MARCDEPRGKARLTNFTVQENELALSLWIYSHQTRILLTSMSYSADHLDVVKYLLADFWCQMTMFCPGNKWFMMNIIRNVAQLQYKDSKRLERAFRLFTRQ